MKKSIKKYLKVRHKSKFCTEFDIEGKTMNEPIERKIEEISDTELEIIKARFKGYGMKVPKMIKNEIKYRKE